jgi:hypothetical protein
MDENPLHSVIFPISYPKGHAKKEGLTKSVLQKKQSESLRFIRGMKGSVVRHPLLEMVRTTH